MSRPIAPYCNTMQVAHSRREFYLVFGQMWPGSAATADIVAQVVVSPAHVKSILHALEDNIKKYEVMFGPIEEAKDLIQ